MAQKSQQELSLNDFQNLSDFDENISQNSIDSDKLIERVDQQLSGLEPKKNVGQLLNQLPTQTFPVKNGPEVDFKKNLYLKGSPKQTTSKQTILTSQNVLSMQSSLKQSNISKDFSNKNLFQAQESPLLQLVKHEHSKQFEEQNIINLLTLPDKQFPKAQNRLRFDQATQTPVKDQQVKNESLRSNKSSDFKQTIEQIKLQIREKQKSPDILGQFINECKYKIAQKQSPKYTHLKPEVYSYKRLSPLKNTLVDSYPVRERTLQDQDRSPTFSNREQKPRQQSPISFLDKKSLEHFIQDLKGYQNVQRMQSRTTNINKIVSQNHKSPFRTNQLTLILSDRSNPHYINHVSDRSNKFNREMAISQIQNFQKTETNKSNLKKSVSNQKIRSQTSKSPQPQQQTPQISNWNDILRRIDYVSREKILKKLEEQVQHKPMKKEISPISQRAESFFISSAYKALYEQSFKFFSNKK